MGQTADRFEEVLEEHSIIHHHMIRGLKAKGLMDGVFLYGPPATGKSTMATMGVDCVDHTIAKDESTQEVFGHYIKQVVRDASGTPVAEEFVWHDGPATIAYRQGKGLVLNEVQFVDSWGKMYALTDTRPNACLTLPTGEVVKRHPKFWCVFTSNSDPSEVLPEGMLSRFPRQIRVATPTPEALESLGDERLAELVLNTYLSREKGRRAGKGGNDEIPIDFRKAQAFIADVKAITFDLAVELHFPDRVDEFKTAYQLGPAAVVKAAKK